MKQIAGRGTNHRRLSSEPSAADAKRGTLFPARQSFTLGVAARIAIESKHAQKPNACFFPVLRRNARTDYGIRTLLCISVPGNRAPSLRLPPFLRGAAACRFHGSPFLGRVAPFIRELSRAATCKALCGSADTEAARSAQRCCRSPERSARTNPDRSGKMRIRAAQTAAPCG